MFKDDRAGTLAHQFCASWVSVCSKFVEINQIIINSIKYAMYNIPNNDNYSKYFVYNDSIYKCNLLYDITSTDVVFWF
mgnify:CR=1 FL=1